MEDLQAPALSKPLYMMKIGKLHISLWFHSFIQLIPIFWSSALDGSFSQIPIHCLAPL